MNFPIPIHNYNLYIPIIFILFVFGSYSLTSILHARVFSKFKPSVLRINVFWESCLILMGCFAISILDLLKFDFYHMALSMLFSPILALFFYKVEFKWNRFIFRKNTQKNPMKSFNQEGSYVGSLKINQKAYSLSANKKLDLQNKSGKVFNQSQKQQNIFITFNLFDLIISAITEEIVYRGFLLMLVLHYLGSLIPLGILIAGFFFGSMHLVYGWNQLFCKSVIGILLSITVIATKTLYIAIFAHVLFNIAAYYLNKNRTHVVTT